MKRYSVYYHTVNTQWYE